MANKICAVTEASDKFFHLTRLSVYSFIEHNRWFDGTLKLLVHQDLPLSQHNLLILKLIYPTIEIISISAQTTNKIKRVASFRNSNKYFDILYNNLKIFAFTLTSTKFVYFSNQCLFLNNVSDILVPRKITCDSNFSIAYVDGETLNVQLDSDNIPQFEDFISTLDRTILPNLSLYSAVAPDAKFNHMPKSKLKSFPCIVFNTFTSESARYSKINQIWLHKNHEIIKFIAKPSSFNKNVAESIGRKSILKNGNTSLNPNTISNKLKYDCDFCVIITTYNRKSCIENLTSKLKKINPFCKIVVIDDCTPEAIDVSNIDFYIRNNENNGRNGWWKTVNLLWKSARKKFNSKYYIMLPDDAVPIDSFFEKTEELWESILDSNKIALHLANNNRTKNWTNFDRISYNSQIYLTQTTEFSFICLPEFIGFNIPPIPTSRWKKNPLLGSGVGQKLNSYWIKNNRNIYGVKSSLITASDLCTDSVMNYHERKINPWILK